MYLLWKSWCKGIFFWKKLLLYKISCLQNVLFFLVLQINRSKPTISLYPKHHEKYIWWETEAPPTFSLRIPQVKLGGLLQSQVGHKSGFLKSNSWHTALFWNKTVVSSDVKINSQFKGNLFGPKVRHFCRANWTLTVI